MPLAEIERKKREFKERQKRISGYQYDEQVKSEKAENLLEKAHKIEEESTKPCTKETAHKLEETAHKLEKEKAHKLERELTEESAFETASTMSSSGNLSHSLCLSPPPSTHDFSRSHIPLTLASLSCVSESTTLLSLSLSLHICQV